VNCATPTGWWAAGSGHLRLNGGGLVRHPLDAVQSSFVPQRPSIVKGVVVEPLPNGVYRVELENGAKVLAHVADRAGTHFTRLLAGDKVGVELAASDRSRGRIREIWR
jgi:translation initiation factor IF-1